MVEIAWWIGGIALGYLVLAPLALALVLRHLVTAGKVDWSGARQPAPADPLEIGYRGDPAAAFGLPFETVHYPTEFGLAEAWVIPAGAPPDLWAVFVHGIGGIRENGYRIARALHEAGVAVMLITYRNDAGAPRGPDGRYNFGLGEWRDLETAVDWTAGQGAARVIVVGESMGAAITGQYLRRAADTARVAGLALDAPALDFPAVVRALARQRFLPFADFVVDAGLWILARLGPDLRQAVCLDAVAGFDGPLFVAHGRHDPLVPFSISERLVARRPDAIFVPSEAAAHLHSYGTDPAAFRAGVFALVEAVRR